MIRLIQVARGIRVYLSNRLPMHLVTFNTNCSRRGRAFVSVCLSVFLRDLSKTSAATITRLDI